MLTLGCAVSLAMAGGTITVKAATTLLVAPAALVTIIW
jgi:hypothetical protein